MIFKKLTIDSTHQYSETDKDLLKKILAKTDDKHILKEEKQVQNLIKALALCNNV